MKETHLNFLLVAIVFAAVSGGLVELKGQTPSRVRNRPKTPALQKPAPDRNADNSVIIAKRIKFVDGGTLDADEVWERGGEVWYSRSGVTELVNRKVAAIEPIYRETTEPGTVPISGSTNRRSQSDSSIWIFLVGGARFKVDEISETADGAWYHRGNLASFIESGRIDRIERGLAENDIQQWTARGWTSGKPAMDALIRTNGNRFGVDPYLVFLVIEQESQFHPRAVSPKGARGLMQLMPGTARRFGVNRPFDPAENIRGGTQYLRLLLNMFGGRIDLALASYNAGEGRVLEYGNAVPPFAETRNYVKRIRTRYASAHHLGAKAQPPGNDSGVTAAGEKP